MVLRWVSLLLVIASGCDAFVRFEHSMLYDEFDFVGQKSITIPLSCTAAGCRVYVSMPSESKDVAANLVIADKITLRTRFSDVALMKQADGQKGFYLVKKGNTFVNLTNSNKDLISAPMMFWIIQADAPNIDVVQAYDAALFYRSPARAGLVTVMSAVPYTLTTDTRGQMTVSATLGGFDLKEECTTVFEQDDPESYQDLNLSVHSPLLTLDFDGTGFPSTTIAMTAKLEQVNDFDLSTRMFAASPGFIGCSTSNEPDSVGNIGTVTFRSSLYDNETNYNFSSDRVQQVILTCDISTDQDHAVIISDSANDKTYRLSGNLQDREFDLQTTDLTIDWTRNDQDLDQTFMCRVEPVLEAERTTTEGSEEKTTSAEVKTSQSSTVTNDKTTPQDRTSLTIDDEKTTLTTVSPGEKTTVPTVQPDQKTSPTTNPLPTESTAAPSATTFLFSSQATEQSNPTTRRTPSITSPTTRSPVVITSSRPIVVSSTLTSTTPAPTTSSARGHGSLVLLSFSLLLVA